MSEIPAAAAELVGSAKRIGAGLDLIIAAVASGQPGDISFAKQAVTTAANNYAGRTIDYQKFAFDTVISAPAVVPVQRERVTRDVLASALVDVTVANGLLAAEAVTQQPSDANRARDLKDAREQLTSVTQVIAAPLTKPLETPIEQTRFGFDAAALPAAPKRHPSANLEEAKTGYTKQLGDTCQALVTDTKTVFTDGYQGLQRLDATEILQALDSFLSHTNTPDVTPTISQALSLAQRVIEKITELTGSENLAFLRDRAKDLLSNLQPDKSLADSFLDLTLQTGKAKDQVGELLSKSTSAPAKLDSGVAELADLQLRFTDQAHVLSRILRVSRGAKGLVGFFPVPSAISASIFGSIYLAVMAYALLAAMDFADAPGPLDYVDGILVISQRVLS